MKQILLFIMIITATSTAGLAKHCDHPMDDYAFKRMIRSMNISESGRYQFRNVMRAARNRCFTSNQIQTIAERLRTDQQRLKFAQVAHKNVVDIENFYDVYDAFNKFSMAFRLHDIVTGVVAGTTLEPRPRGPKPIDIYPIEVACEPSQMELNAIKRSLKAEAFPRERLRQAEILIKDYCFNVGQIKGLMDLFTFSSYKVDLLKITYDNCIDPQNYYQLIDKLTFPSEKRELRRFIESKRNQWNS